MTLDKGDDNDNDGHHKLQSPLPLEPECIFTERQAVDLMDQLLPLLSAQQQQQPVQPEPLQDMEASDETFIVVTTKSTSSITTNDDVTDSSSTDSQHPQPQQYQYATITHLRRTFVTYLHQVQRCTTAQAATALGLFGSIPKDTDENSKKSHCIPGGNPDGDNKDFLTRILFHAENFLQTNQITVVQDDENKRKHVFLTEPYLRNAAEAVYERLVSNNGCVPISQVAREYHFSLDTCRTLLTPRLVSFANAQQSEDSGNTVLEKRSANGTLMYVTRQHLVQLQADVCRILREKAAAAGAAAGDDDDDNEAKIIHIPDVCREHDWDITWVLELLSSHNNNNNKSIVDDLPGTFQRGHQDFIPHAYRKRQRTAVWQQYQTHGYIITNATAAKTDNLPPQQLWDIIQEMVQDEEQQQSDDDFNNVGQQAVMTDRGDGAATALQFSDCIMNYAVIGVPLEAVLQEAWTEASWCELRLPVDLLDECPHNVQEFLHQHVLPRVIANNHGKENSSVGNVTKGFDTTTGTLTLTAERVLYMSGGMMHQIQEYIQETLVNPLIQAWAAKLLQSSSKGKGVKANDESSSFVSWSEYVTQQISSSSEAFVSTSSLVECLLQGFNQFLVLPYEGDDGILEKYVTQHFQENEGWLASVIQGIAKECIRREAAACSSVVTTADTTLKITSLEDPSCFPAACHMIQMQRKFLEYARKVGMACTDTLEEETLHGACRDLVRRLTLFLLAKYGVEERLLEFDVEASNQKEQKQHAKYISSYGTPVDTALRQYPRVLVRYATEDDEDDADCDAAGNKKERMLAQALTDAVPLQVSQALTELDQANSVDEFLRLAEDNCLTICGIPFRKLDKKSEKSFLAHRKERLAERLQASGDPGDVLDYTIMLIYQSIKHQTAFGSLIRGPILEQLVQERKISEAVGQVLRDLAEHVNSKVSSTDNEEDLIEWVRGCGLAKDIAKHSVE